MKYVYKIIPGVILFMGLAGACKDDDSTSIPGGIAVDKEEITIGPEGGTEQIAVTSYSNWVAGASKPWIFVSPANGSSSAECQWLVIICQSRLCHHHSLNHLVYSLVLTVNLVCRSLST